MANTKSAKKAFRSSEKKNIVNTARINRIRSFIKKVDGAIKVGDEAKAREAFKNLELSILLFFVFDLLFFKYLVISNNLFVI